MTGAYVARIRSRAHGRPRVLAFGAAAGEAVPRIQLATEPNVFGLPPILLVDGGPLTPQAEADAVQISAGSTVPIDHPLSGWARYFFEPGNGIGRQACQQANPQRHADQSPSIPA